MSDNQDQKEKDIDLEAVVQRRAAKEAQSNKGEQNEIMAKDKAEQKKQLQALAESSLKYGGETSVAGLYVALCKDLVAYDSEGDNYLLYGGASWDIDREYRHVALIEEKIVPIYLGLLKEVNKKIIECFSEGQNDEVKFISVRKKKIEKLLLALRGKRFKQNVLWAASTNPENITVPLSDFDQHKYLLATRNVVIDLRTGEATPPKPELYISKNCTAEWKGLDAPAKKWLAFLDSCHDSDQIMVSYLRRAIGYAVCGDPIENDIFFFFGASGANGKSLFCSVINEVLGSYARTIPIETLLSQRNSGGATPELLMFKGLLVAFLSEPPAGAKWADGRFKMISGGEEITARGTYGKFHSSFKPTHTIFIGSNIEPKAPGGSDGGFWRRMKKIGWSNTFVDHEPKKPNERKKIKGLANQIIKEEAAGVLAWIVKGAIEYQQEGLNTPEEVLGQTAAYQLNEDIVAQFLDEMCDSGPNYEVAAAVLYEKFKEWYVVNIGERLPPSALWLGQQLTGRAKRFRRANMRMYSGIGIK